MFYDCITKYTYTEIFCWKIESSFCKSFLYFLNKKYLHISDIYIWNFNEMLTKNVVSFEQPGSDG